MTRILLAFLALLGLVAQAAPAEARVCGVGVTQVGMVAPARGISRALASRTADAAQPGPGAQPRHDGCSPAVPTKRPEVYVPTVQMGIDRAHE